MLRKDDQVLDVDNAVAPGHRADITQRLVCAPKIHHDTHVGRVHNSIAIKVNDRIDGYLIEIGAAIPTVTVGAEIKSATIG